MRFEDRYIGDGELPGKTSTEEDYASMSQPYRRLLKAQNHDAWEQVELELEELGEDDTVPSAKWAPPCCDSVLWGISYPLDSAAGGACEPF